MKEISSWFPYPQITPTEWLAQHRECRQYFWGPRDTRIPAFLPRLAQELCTLRSSLEYLRLAFESHGQALQQLRQDLATEKLGLDGKDPEGHTLRLIDSFLSRIDWREQDILEMMLEYVHSACGSGNWPDDARSGYESLQRELDDFHKLRERDRSAYDRAVQGLISETRGNLVGLTRTCRAMHEHQLVFRTFNESALRLLVQALGRLLGVPDDFLAETPDLPDDPAQLWTVLAAEGQKKWQQLGLVLPLKPFEKASLFLLECAPLEDRGHAGFVRYVLEHDAAYRRLLACCYAPQAVQRQRLVEEMTRYNRLPENASRQVSYQEEEQQLVLYAVLLRPDAVAAIAERERYKDIYRVISGLSAKAYLPRVLHEVQNIFGYLTPEAFERVVAVLQLDPLDVIRVVASYKQYSADPGGDIIIYLCKGTACFLRGQPELSRRLAAEIKAEEGELGRHGIQFIEMDCFGVCHLAPVIKTRDGFLGKRTVGDIPQMLEQLLRGPSFENRTMFLNRIRNLLAPGRESDPLEEVRIVAIIEDDHKQQSPPGKAGLSGQPPSQSPGSTGTGTQWAEPAATAPEPGASTSVQGHCLKLDASGQVFACLQDVSQPLGSLVPHSLAFRYGTPDGLQRLGGVVLDEMRQLQTLVNFTAPGLERELDRSLKPQVYVADGSVWVERAGPPLRLGSFTSNALALQTASGGHRLIELSGPPSLTPPEKEALSPAGQGGGTAEDPAFLSLQDRLVLGFTAEADPDEIDSYLAQGGYEAVQRVLGRRDSAAWEHRSIVTEVTNARLRGRGGAGFPTGRKWESMRLAKCVVQENDESQDPIKLIVANGDEGDPGAFMDRTIIQERPHQVIEGMVLAALAVGARYGVIYVRKEYEDAVRRLEHALFQARRKGYLGENIFGVDGFHFDLDIRLGAGAFVAGEKRAIMRAIEGEPAEPTFNAPSNTLRGLWGKPTLLNNVETFANVPLIIQRGGNWYAQQGTDKTGGSKIFSVAGIVSHTGLVEVRFGRTLQDVIRICGGIQQDKHLAGVQIGGPSGAILSLTGVRSYLLHTPLDFDAFDQVGAMLGSGGLVFIGEDDDVVRLARHFTDWLADESCGQCPACLQGTVSLGKTLDVILQGEGCSDHIHALWAKSDAIKAGSQCGLGMTAANPVTSALRFFPHAFLHYLLGNPRLNLLELFQSLEALRLLTRESVERIAVRRRQVVGYSFTVKKHLLRYLVQELERLDRYRPAHLHQAEHLLRLLQIPSHEVGVRDLSLECTLDELEQHRLALRDSHCDPNMGRLAQVM
jgi:NADH:ubiquinone oxidoreductase subunit F (NADH-binding)/NADH:ubiquinone oxidoreductase subunit E